jgi:hypothetical protein
MHTRPTRSACPSVQSELLPAMRRAVHRPGQINAVAIAAATILKAGLASRRQGQRLAVRAVSRSVIAPSAARVSAEASWRFSISFSAFRVNDRRRLC